MLNLYMCIRFQRAYIELSFVHKNQKLSRLPRREVGKTMVDDNTE